MNTIPMPNADKVNTLLAALFDSLDVKAGGNFDQSADGGSWLGVFVADSGETIALCGSDVNLSAILGAALSMLPVTSAKEAIKTRNLGNVMTDNVREVMNICSRLVMDATSPHLKLENIYPRKSLPAHAAGLLAAAKNRSNFTISIGKYGSGVMTLLAA